MTARRRVGITGFMHEVNGFAAPVTLAHGIDASRHEGGLGATWEAGPLVDRLHAHDVDVVEFPVWEFGATGPLDGDDFRAITAAITAALAEALRSGPLDGLVVLGHGAGRTSDDLDPDGTLFVALRQAMGPSVPIVVVLDFHANLTARMCAAVDVVVGYLTNPHVDIAERLVEAADQMVRLFDGRHTALVWCQLPLVLPQLAQLTSADEPFGRVMATATTAAAAIPAVRNVSVFGGFSLGDVPECGASVCLTVDRGAEHDGVALVERIAAALWAERPNYRLRATPVADAVAIARRAGAGERTPVILADVADNPGGGAPANSTEVLRALCAAEVQATVLGLQCDPPVVAAAWVAGVGRTVRVTFNEGSDHPLARPLTVEGRVTALVDAPFVPSRGVYAGQTRHPGRSCALQVAGVHVGVSSHPVQCADADTLAHVGLRPEEARVVVVKSRGHFRAGFDHLFAPDQIVEVEAPGVATPALHLLHWQHLPRPVFPLDPLDHHEPVITVTTRSTV